MASLLLAFIIMIQNVLDGSATIQDFINLYGEEEAIEITNLCDPLEDTINTDKLQAMLDNAKEMVLAKFIIANDCGRALIKVSAKQLILWIARYIGDSTKSRPFVSEDYDKAMEFIEYACRGCADRCPLTKTQIDDILGIEGLLTRSKLRCFSGYGNQIKRLPRLPKVDYYSDHIPKSHYNI